MNNKKFFLTNTSIWIVLLIGSIFVIFSKKFLIDWKVPLGITLNFLIFSIFHLTVAKYYNKNPNVFISIFLLLLFGKMIVLAALFLVLILISKEYLIAFSIVYLLTFFIYLVLEIKYWLNELTKN